MTTLVPNAEFARLASDEQIATAVAALTANGMAAEAVESAGSREARARMAKITEVGFSPTGFSGRFFSLCHVKKLYDGPISQTSNALILALPPRAKSPTPRLSVLDG